MSMLIYILKFSACLAVFMAFYKLLLEKESIHRFKRFYLIGIILISLGIPFITFITYIEVEPVVQNLNTPLNDYSKIDFNESTPIPKDFKPSVLWSIYILGVVLFSFRSFKNLFQLLKTISRNHRIKHLNFQYVLLENSIAPHTFFKFIFLNKSEYELHQIPEEVFLHEQTHAIQKHSADILFVEAMQVLFWFNPLLYFIKKDIKLNHEFLADEAVLKQGIIPSNYQKTLLAFSSQASNSIFANAINYSSIKKRIIIMKTQTSKKAIWLRTIIILPLLAFLVFGFSEKTIEKIETQNDIDNQIHENLTYKINLYNYLNEKRLEAEIKLKKSNIKDSTELKLIKQRLDLIRKDIEKSTKNEFLQKKLNKNDILFFITDNEIITINKNQYHLDTLEKLIIDLLNNLSTVEKEQYNPIIIHNDSPEDYKTLLKLETLLRKHNILRFDKKPQLNIYRKNDTIVISTQQKATPEEIEEYNRILNKFSGLPEKKRIIKLKDYNRLQYIYNKMSKEQKANTDTLPKIPTPPKPQQKTIPKKSNK